MNDTEREKIKRFMHDEVMSRAVKDLLQKSFLKSRKDQDVHVLAASKLAVEYLEEAWTDMKRLKESPTPENDHENNVGM